MMKRSTETSMLNRARRKVHQQFLIATRLAIRREHRCEPRFPLSVRSSLSCAPRVNQKVVFFTPLWNASKSSVRDLSNNSCSLDAIDEWSHWTAHNARPGSISLFPDFRPFFWPPQRYFVTPIVYCRGTVQISTPVLFP